MKLKCINRCIAVVFLLFFSSIGVYAQHEIKFLRQKGDTLILSATDIERPVRCFVKLNLMYYTNMDGLYSLSKAVITNIDIRELSNNKRKILISCPDTQNQYLCDILSKYINDYYTNPQRFKSSIELTTLSKYYNLVYVGDIKIETSFSAIYIYPSKSKHKK